MKRITFFALCLYSLVSYRLQAQPPCLILSNVSVKCINAGPPQILQVGFTYTSANPYDSILVFGYTGNIIGQLNIPYVRYKVNNQGSTGNVSFMVSRYTPANNFVFLYQVMKNGNTVCRGSFNQNITQACPPVSTPCMSVSGFSAVCQGSGYQIGFVATPALADSIVMFSYNGTIVGEHPSKKYKVVTNGPTNVSINYTPNNPMPAFCFAYIAYKSGSEVCRNEICTQISSCGPSCNGNYFNIGWGPISHWNTNGYTNYTAPYLGVLGGLTGGPSLVTKIETTISNVKRRTLCPGQPAGSWQPMASAALTPTQLSSPPGTYASNSNTGTILYNPPADLTGISLPIPDYTSPFTAPVNKLNANCPEEYEFDIKICMYFKNGCTQCRSFTGLKATRP